jgi:uncharacterized protein (DUF58 family)
MTATADATAGTARLPQNAFRRIRQRLFRVDPQDRDPVVLRHNRIYILPTGRGMAFMGTLLMMLVTSLNYALSLGFAVTFLISGMVAAALLHTFRNLLGVELSPLAAGETFAGNPLQFTFAVRGAATARHAIVFTAPGCNPVAADVPPDSAATIKLERSATRRGRHALGRVTLDTRYPLGLWRGWAYAHFPLQGIAYPAPEANAPPLPGGHGGSDPSAGTRSDDADLAGLRGYQPGDPMQRVAWKAVARGAGWHTKQFEGAGGGGPVELSWFALASGLDTEQRLSRLTAWVLAAERAARPFALTLPGYALPPGQGRAHRRAALTALAVFEDTA